MPCLRKDRLPHGEDRHGHPHFPQELSEVRGMQENPVVSFVVYSWPLVILDIRVLLIVLVTDSI